MHIIVVGLNHRSAPIELRERSASRREQLPYTLARLRDDVELQEVAILSTCNRVEIYAGVPELNGTIPRLHQFLSVHGGVPLPSLAERLYSYTEPQSVRHLFSVASGLDSMVLGEAEILHQVKHAYAWANEVGATGKVLHGLFQRALNAAKAVRTQTMIGQGCMSIGTVAVELAQKIFSNLSGTVVLLVGAGKIGELALNQLALRGVRELRIMNRSPERAIHLAQRYRATPVRFEQLRAQLLEVDIMVSSTSASAVMLSRHEVASIMRARRHRPLCLVDLGVPRNIEPTVGTIERVHLFDVDDLQGLVEHAHQGRQQALDHSQVIIEQKVDCFLSWWQREAMACVPSSLGLAEVH